MVRLVGSEMCIRDRSYSVTDTEIKSTIKSVYTAKGVILCPHTAVAEFIREKNFKDIPVMIVGTAHPAKFETIIEPLINKQIDIPPSLASVLSRDSHYDTIENDLEAFYSVASRD